MTHMDFCALASSKPSAPMVLPNTEYDRFQPLEDGAGVRELHNARLSKTWPTVSIPPTRNKRSLSLCFAPETKACAITTQRCLRAHLRELLQPVPLGHLQGSAGSRLQSIPERHTHTKTAIRKAIKPCSPLRMRGFSSALTSPRIWARALSFMIDGGSNPVARIILPAIMTTAASVSLASFSREAVELTYRCCRGRRPGRKCFCQLL